MPFEYTGGHQGYIRGHIDGSIRVGLPLQYRHSGVGSYSEDECPTGILVFEAGGRMQQNSRSKLHHTSVGLATSPSVLRHLHNRESGPLLSPAQRKSPFGAVRKSIDQVILLNMWMVAAESRGLMNFSMD